MDGRADTDSDERKSSQKQVNEIKKQTETQNLALDRNSKNAADTSRENTVIS